MPLLFQKVYCVFLRMYCRASSIYMLENLALMVPWHSTYTTRFSLLWLAISLIIVAMETLVTSMDTRLSFTIMESVVREGFCALPEGSHACLDTKMTLLASVT